MQEKTVFCGMKGKLVPTSDLWGKVDLRDYFEREEFAVRNAVPTAEGLSKSPCGNSPAP